MNTRKNAIVKALLQDFQKEEVLKLALQNYFKRELHVFNTSINEQETRTVWVGIFETNRMLALELDEISFEITTNDIGKLDGFVGLMRSMDILEF